MILSLLATALLVPVGQDHAPIYRWESSRVFIEGEPWTVGLKISLPPEECPALPIWVMTPAAFTLNGRALGKREMDPRLTLLPGSQLELSFDLGSVLLQSEAFDRKNFRISYAQGASTDVRDVTFLEAAEKGIAFMDLPVEQLADYDVVLRTSEGEIWLQLWPNLAPNHVRNFLDLCYTGFYDDTTFHRVVPTFMIQGGTAKESRPAPRRLNQEYNETRHIAGILSMARLPDEAPDADNSATSEFFIMHGVAPTLDGKYTAFGRVVTGMSVVDSIANSGNRSYERNDPRSHVPPIDQVIRKAVVVKAPRQRPKE